jgi:hypothetical protein
VIRMFVSARRARKLRRVAQRKQQLYEQKLLRKRLNKVATVIQACIRGRLARKTTRKLAQQAITDLKHRAMHTILNAVRTWMQRYHLRKERQERMIAHILHRCLHRRIQCLRSAAKYAHIQLKRGTMERVNAGKIVPKGLTNQLLLQVADVNDSFAPSLAKQFLNISQRLSAKRTKSGNLVDNVSLVDPSRRLEVIHEFQMQQQQQYRPQPDVGISSTSDARNRLPSDDVSVSTSGRKSLTMESVAAPKSVLQNRRTIALKKVNILVDRSTKTVERVAQQVAEAEKTQQYFQNIQQIQRFQHEQQQYMEQEEFSRQRQLQHSVAESRERPQQSTSRSSLRSDKSHSDSSTVYS